MKKYFAGLLLLGVTASASLADTFNINGREVIVPAPEGFVRITPEMKAVTWLAQQLSGPDIEMLAYYIAEDEVPAALDGDIPDLTHTFVLQISKGVRDLIFRDRDFFRLKQIHKTKNKELLDAERERLEGRMTEISEDVSKTFNVDFSMSLSAFVPLEPHFESRNALAWSMYVHFNKTSDGREPQIAATTMTVVNVSGTVVTLMANGTPATLEATSEAAMLWMEAVFASNGMSPDTANASDSLFASRMIGLVMGTLIAFLCLTWILSFLVKRFTSKKNAG